MKGVVVESSVSRGPSSAHIEDILLCKLNVFLGKNKSVDVLWRMCSLRPLLTTPMAEYVRSGVVDVAGIASSFLAILARRRWCRELNFHQKEGRCV